MQKREPGEPREPISSSTHHFVREGAIPYHAAEKGAGLIGPLVLLSPDALFPHFPASSPGPYAGAAPPSDHPPSTASDTTPAPGRVWWYVLYEELARRDAAIDALAERVDILERESCLQRKPPWERRKYYE